MNFYGIDPAGEKNTWVSHLSKKGLELALEIEPACKTKLDIVDEIIDNEIDTVVIDGQLNYHLGDVSGWRDCDHEMRAILDIEKSWIQSSNSMMSVPVNARILAEHIKPHVPCIFETHPRVILYQFARIIDDNTAKIYVKNYKKNKDTINKTCKEMTGYLANVWICKNNIKVSDGVIVPTEDGALDSLVCATVAYTYHNSKKSLVRLKSGNNNTRGMGPILILNEDDTNLFS